MRVGGVVTDVDLQRAGFTDRSQSQLVSVFLTTKLIASVDSITLDMHFNGLLHCRFMEKLSAFPSKTVPGLHSRTREKVFLNASLSLV